ncbi:hypothetical protein E2542_SST02576 [Spatholobus suberectus]|nr:hypothetical protein E2542_SST02576 [Spatholobus suberectus]
MYKLVSRLQMQSLKRTPVCCYQWLQCNSDRYFQSANFLVVKHIDFDDMLSLIAREMGSKSLKCHIYKMDASCKSDGHLAISIQGYITIKEWQAYVSREYSVSQLLHC